jgi:Pyridoxamine 5'-phosphate oxidase
MAVATVDADGYPDARMLLLKGMDKQGFVFYTNMQSPKAQALLHEPRAALCFYWDKIGKQVRVRGRAETVSDEEADAYFANGRRSNRSRCAATLSLKLKSPKRRFISASARCRVRRSGRDFVSCRIGSSFGRKSHFAATSALRTSACREVGINNGSIRSHSAPCAITAQQSASAVHRSCV